MSNVTSLVPVGAQIALTELIAALGTENNPAQWMIFMQAVTKHLPEVLSSGRPTKEAIQRCAIGQLGFNSWAEMIESPNGLNWNISGWKAYRRSWSIVENNEWLLNEKYSCSELNQLSINFKKSGIEFPKSPEELKNLLEIQIAQKKEKALEQTSALKENIESLSSENKNLVSETTNLKGQIQALENALNQAHQKLINQSQLMGQVHLLKDQLKTAQDLNQKLNSVLSKYQNHSRLDYLKAFLRGDLK